MTKPERYEYKPLENLLRSIGDDYSKDAAELEKDLAHRGLDSGEISQKVKAKISEFLKRKQGARHSATLRTFAPRRSQHTTRWYHPSVVRFSAGDDPIQQMISQASAVVLAAYENARAEPGVIDPFALAAFLGISVVPREDIADARTVPLGGRRLQIEFNSRQPKARTRFSIAHEIAHTFLPDCHERIRNRLVRTEFEKNDWELEMLCNIGAAELLMPIASFPALKDEQLGIDHLMALRRRYEVSSEAILLRVAALTDHACAVFAASRQETLGQLEDRYHLDYVIASRSWEIFGGSGLVLGKKTILSQSTAIGYTAKGDEVWPASFGLVHVECVGIFPYRQRRYPRVVGIASPLSGRQLAAGPRLLEVVGDATEPRGEGNKIVAHIVNDRTPNWGAGFGLAVAKKWPVVQQAFRSWALHHRGDFRLGTSFRTDVTEELCVYQMICQHGFGPSPKPRIRYSVLKTCLEELATLALERNATVHMPRIGSGYAGGIWEIMRQMVDEILCRRGIPVTIYNLNVPSAPQAPELPGLFSKSIRL